MWKSLLVVLFALSGCREPPPPAYAGTDLRGVPWGADFTLVSHEGRRVTTTDLRGQVLLIFFGFTHCPDICAPTMAKLDALRRQMGPQGRRMLPIFVSVDPTRDTPERLARFLRPYDTPILGLTGEPETLRQIERDFKVSVTDGDSGAPAHSGGVFVKDAAGKLRLYFREGMSIEAMRQDLTRLLSEPGMPKSGRP